MSLIAPGQADAIIPARPASLPERQPPKAAALSANKGRSSRLSRLP